MGWVSPVTESWGKQEIDSSRESKLTQRELPMSYNPKVDRLVTQADIKVV